MMGVPSRLPEIERKGRLERFKKWLVANGSEILATTNDWEVLRFRGDRGTAIIYRNAGGQLNWQNGSDRAYKAWKNKKPWRAQPKTRRKSKQIQRINALIERDGRACFYCGVEMADDEMTIEHFVAVTHGGPNHISNQALTHQKCNAAVGHLSVPEKVRHREKLRGAPPAEKDAPPCEP